MLQKRLSNTNKTPKINQNSITQTNSKKDKSNDDLTDVTYELMLECERVNKCVNSNTTTDCAFSGNSS